MALLGAVAASACAGRIAPAPAQHGEQPQVSWRIGTGNLAGTAREEVCASDTDTSCVIRAGSDDDARGAAVSVYLYSGPTEARFSGAVFAGFIEGADGSPGHELPLRRYGVEGGDHPPMIAAAGSVVSVPGDYVLRVSLLAEVDGQLDPYQLSVSVPVRVIAGGGE